jgi:hypothetical protein
MKLVGASDKDGVVNSDLAFWGKLAFSGNYDGFRILDISNPSKPKELVDYYCRGPQNDVSVYRAGGRLLLFQSIDTPQTQESCDGTREGSSKDMPLSTTFPGQRQFGFEGIRVFDVTNPRKPVFLDGIPTACGSHTHTLVPEPRKKRIHLYVSSYPLGSGVTPTDDPNAPANLRCAKPHQQIGIITVPTNTPTLRWSYKAQPLSDDTAMPPGVGREFKACHDIQVFMPRKLAVGACGGDAQIWDISDPSNPTTQNGRPHTHIHSPDPEKDVFEFIHNAVVTWDGKYVGIADETGGGGSAECDGGPEQEGKGESEHGFYYFYKLPAPGDPRADPDLPLHDPPSAGHGDLRVAQRQHRAAAQPLPAGRRVLPGRQHRRRLHRRREPAGDGVQRHQRRPRRHRLVVDVLVQRLRLRQRWARPRRR